MARTKSPSGPKTTRTSNGNKETGANIAPNAAEVKVTAPEAEVAAVAAQTEVAPKADTKPEPKREVKPEVKAEVKTQATPEPKKLEVVKSEPKKNLVPINLEDEIRRRAYELYQQRGMNGGGAAEDWFKAEQEVRQRYRQQSA
jgi:hypothetical protein